MSDLRTLASFWWRRRFHPLTRIGWQLLGRATAEGGQAQTVLAAGMIVTGFYLRRRQQKTLLYRGEVFPGESLRIRLLDRGRVLDELEVGG